MKKLIGVFVVSFLLTFTLSSAALAEILYDNGGPNGQLSAWNITQVTGSAYSITNSFTLPTTSTITGVTFYSWVNAGDKPLTANWAITTSPFVTGPNGPTNLTYSFLYSNGDGYDVGSNEFTISPLVLSAGTYWLQIENATSQGQDSVYWDVNNGPSQAWANWNGPGSVENYLFAGSNSSAFQIIGTSSAPVPIPAAVWLFGSGLLGLFGVRRKLRK